MTPDELVLIMQSLEDIDPANSSIAKVRAGVFLLLDEVEELRAALLNVRSEALEEAARLYESINPASDEERRYGAPGAGAMGAVLEYRDAIRAMKAAAEVHEWMVRAALEDEK